MKKLSYVITTLAATLIMTSCSKQESMSYLSITEAEGIIPGNWRVDYYNGNDADQYTQYTFEFMTDGSLTVTDAANSYTGTWLILNTNEDPVYDKELDISLSGNPELEALASKWLVTEMTQVRMNLLDDAGGQEVFFLKN